jgi:CHASE2 domain-containing sensor protein
MQYHNFDIWIDEKDKASLEYHLRANIETFDSASGLMHINPASAEVNNILERFAQRDTDRQFLVEVGTLLYDALFSAEGRDIHALFEQCSGKFLNTADEGIRLRLRIEAPEIAALPWEFLYSPGNDTFLSAWIRTPVVRYLDVGMPIRTIQTSLPLRMLVVIPSSPDLDAAEEKKLLLRALKQMEPYVQPRFLEGNVSLVQIEEALQENSLHIFHFIGHGDLVGDQAFLQLGTKGERVDQETLGRLFQNHEDMKLIFLNACKGAQTSPGKPFLGMAPQLVRKGVPAVVAMQYSIYDDVAVQFSRMFYQCLFKGKDRGRIDMAMNHARNALLVHYPEERVFGAPVLFLHSPEGVLFDLPADKRDLRLPFSAGEVKRLQAVAQTHNYNIDMVKDSEADAATKMAQIQDAEERIRQIQQTLKYRRNSLVTAVVVAVLVFFLCCLFIFDRLNVSMQSYTMALGDLLRHKEFRDDIVTVALTQEEQEDRPFGKSWRADHAVLVDNLSKAGAKVVAFDMDFEDRPESDAALRDAVMKARDKERPTSVIVGIIELDEGEPALAKELRSAVTGWGALTIGKRGYARLVPLVIQKERRPESNIPGLALQAFAAYEGGDEKVRLIDFNHDRKQIMVGFGSEGQQVRKLGFFESYKIPAGEGYLGVLDNNDVLSYLAIDLTPTETIREESRRYSYTYIRDHPDPETLRQLQKKIVIVGVENENERHEGRWGFELHADAINTLLKGVVIRPVAPGSQFALIMILSIVGAAVRTRMRYSSRRLRISLLITVLLVYFAGAIYLYTQHRLLLNTVYHAVALLLTYWIVGKLERRYLE